MLYNLSYAFMLTGIKVYCILTEVCLARSFRAAGALALPCTCSYSRGDGLPRALLLMLPMISGVDVRVLRNGNL